MEILISIMLVIKRVRLVAFFGAFSLMTMFTAYVVAILNFSSYIPCSCGGVLEKLGWREHLFFNAGFVLLGLAGIVLEDRTDNEGAGRADTTKPNVDV